MRYSGTSLFTGVSGGLKGGCAKRRRLYFKAELYQSDPKGYPILAEGKLSE
jgi:hypothetical protein